jgi:hypothetical protein
MAQQTIFISVHLLRHKKNHLNIELFRFFFPRVSGGAVPTIQLFLTTK